MGQWEVLNPWITYPGPKLSSFNRVLPRLTSGYEGEEIHAVVL